MAVGQARYSSSSSWGISRCFQDPPVCCGPHQGSPTKTSTGRHLNQIVEQSSGCTLSSSDGCGSGGRTGWPKGGLVVWFPALPVNRMTRCLAFCGTSQHFHPLSLILRQCPTFWLAQDLLLFISSSFHKTPLQDWYFFKTLLTNGCEKRQALVTKVHAQCHHVNQLVHTWSAG